MKKFLLYFLVFIFICFLLPAILTKTEISANSETSTETSAKTSDKTIPENVEQEKNKETNKQAYNYKKYSTIQLLHKETGQVENVELDTYLCNVVSAEMPVDYEIEALKAQAVVARTYTIYKVNNKKHENADICDDSNCCQAWVSKEKRLKRWEEDKRETNWAKIEQCVNETKRQSYYLSKSTN